MPELFNYSYRVAPLNLLAGLTDFEIAIDARKIIYTSPNDGPELSVRLQSKSNDEIKLRPQGIIIAPFNRLYISGPVSALTPQLIIASPADVSIESRDVNVSNISTLATITNPVISKDFLIYISQLSQHFERTVTVAAGGAGTFSTGQVFNPVASGKTVVVLQVEYSNNVPGLWSEIRQHNAALGTLVGNLFNLDNGAANSVAEFRSAVPAAIPGANLLHRGLQATTLIHRVPRYDVLSPGEGLAVGFSGANQPFDVGFRIWEF